MRARVVTACAALVLAIGVSSFMTDPSEARNQTDFSAHSPNQDMSKSVPALLNYQGFLATADSGAVNETLPMTFRLYGSASGGMALWSETHPAVEVSNGGFSLLLGSVTPFPADLFDGSILYLEMEVGGEVFSPRKTIVSVAYSVMSDHADTANYAAEAHHSVHADTAAYSTGTGSWTTSGENVYRLTGNVGIGTASPATKLDVVGNVDADGFTINGTPIGTSTDTYWSKTGTGGDIHYSDGNVGIGTVAPSARLQVEGSKGSTGSLCTSDEAVWGQHSSGTKGSLGSNDYGAYGRHAGSGNEGYLGSDEYGAYGKHAVSGNEGVLGGDVWAVFGEHHGSGNEGWIGAGEVGVYGSNASTYNYGFLGGQGDNNYGAGGITFSESGKGVYGYNNVNGNCGWLGDKDRGVCGQNGNGNFGWLGSEDHAVYGQHSGGNFGTLGEQNYGVYGHHNNNNNGYIGSSDDGVYGYSSTRAGVYGTFSNTNYGALGTSAYGACGQNGNGNFGWLGGENHAVYGQHSSGSFGTLGEQNYAVFGHHSSSNEGCLGSSNYGAYGHHSNGNYGYLGGGAGAYGRYQNGNYGSLGNAANAVYGQNSNGNEGILGQTQYGARGENNNGNFGLLGDTQYGAFGKHSNGNYGFLGGTDKGVYGINAGKGTWGALGGSDYGVYGTGPYGLYGDGPCGVYGKGGDYGLYAEGEYAVYASGSSCGVYAIAPVVAGVFYGTVGVHGDMSVSGTITKGECNFKIDDPLDPENKYLYHSCVESPDLKNIYDGVVQLDGHGQAWVELPEWFEPLNRDFRYQLTPIGAPGPDLYIAEEISGGRFQIAGGNPNMRVSWQVTGIRQDPYANLHPIRVEEDKPLEEHGYYLHPDAYGQPEEKGIAWLHRPDVQGSMKEKIPASQRTFDRESGAEKIASPREVQTQTVEPAALPPAEGRSTIESAPKGR